MLAKKHNDKQKKPINQVLKAKFFFVAELVFGLTLVAAAFSGFIIKYISTHGSAKLPSSQRIVSGAESDEEPSEEAPSAEEIARYSVPDDQPRTIRINSVGIFGLVQRVGLTDTNALAVPTNIFFAGWYANGPRPGDVGLSVIDGHVLGTYKDAIFKQLSKVKPRDEVEIEFGDGSIKKFSVIDSKRLPIDKSAQYLFSKKPDVASQLNIITCDGAYDKVARTYTNRLVVRTKFEP